MAGNLDVFHAYISSYENGDQCNLKKYLHPEHSYYAPGNSEKMNLKERIDDEHYFFDGFSEIKTDIADELIDGEKIAARIVMKCRHTGDFHGIKATGKEIQISYIEIVHFKDDLIIDEWAEFDMATILNQIQ